MRRTDVISAVALLALALAALLEASKLPFGVLNSPQPGFFPLILAILLAIFSLTFLAESIRGSKGESLGSSTQSAIWKRIVLAVGALVVFGVVFESLGYIISTFLFIAFLLRVVEQQKWSLVLVVAFFTSLATYLVFGLFLSTPLPGGILVSWNQSRHNSGVIPGKLAAIPPRRISLRLKLARPGIQEFQKLLDSRFHENDGIGHSTL